MCNFWDGKNLAGLRRMILQSCTNSPTPRELRPTRKMTPADASRAVVLRGGPREEASAVGALRPGEAADFDAECAGWLRMKTAKGEEASAKGVAFV